MLPSDVTLARWYSFPADALTRAFFQPSAARLWIAAEPENVTMQAQITLDPGPEGKLTWGRQPNAFRSCAALELERAEGPLLVLSQGDMLNFNNQAWAQLDSLGEPYYREWEMWSLDDKPMPKTDSVLLSYAKCTFLTLPPLHPTGVVHLLEPVESSFFEDPAARRIHGY